MVNDIIEIIVDRFICFNMYLRFFNNYSFRVVVYNYYDRYEDVVCHMFFYNTYLAFRFIDSDVLNKFYYSDLDIGVLVGLFMCRVYYNG